MCEYYNSALAPLMLLLTKCTNKVEKRNTRSHTEWSKKKTEPIWNEVEGEKIESFKPLYDSHYPC